MHHTRTNAYGHTPKHLAMPKSVQTVICLVVKRCVHPIEKTSSSGGEKKNGFSASEWRMPNTSNDEWHLRHWKHKELTNYPKQNSEHIFANILYPFSFSSPKDKERANATYCQTWKAYCLHTKIAIVADDGTNEQKKTCVCVMYCALSMRWEILCNFKIYSFAHEMRFWFPRHRHFKIWIRFLFRFRHFIRSASFFHANPNGTAAAPHYRKMTFFSEMVIISHVLTAKW